MTFPVFNQLNKTEIGGCVGLKIMHENYHSEMSFSSRLKQYVFGELAPVESSLSIFPRSGRQTIA